MQADLFQVIGSAEAPSDTNSRGRHILSFPSTLFKTACPVYSCRRPVEDDDDDIQFICEKPVKRRRTSNAEKTDTPVAPQLVRSSPPPVVLMTPISPIFPDLLATEEQARNGPRDTERRLSTGMVCLPTDSEAVQLTYALRGVSMPVLNNFTFAQPQRHRPPNPPSPSLSPRQHPSTVPPRTPQTRRVSTSFGLQQASDSIVACSTPTREPQATGNPAVAPTATMTASNNNALQISAKPSPKNILMPPPPPPPPLPLPLPHLACSKVPEHSSTAHNSVNPRSRESQHSNPAKEPCQACLLMRQHAQVPRQGRPLVNTVPPHHYAPQMHCHQAYSHHIRPPMMAIPASNMHQFGAPFAPGMMPTSYNPFGALATHPRPTSQSHSKSSNSQPQAQPLPPQMTTQDQPGPEKTKPSTSDQQEKTQTDQETRIKKTTTDSNTTTSPVRPPVSLLQPTYRKPSPNLIVDVAETCQERFPFEELAQRHNVPVEKVFDVFAAIIQVPLLRCPTDRRRAGKLATARIKEYNKAKKDIEESRASDPRQGETSNLRAIAQTLGEVELPEGFTLEELSSRKGN
ncbi:hypothetical protein GGS20DRAFT_576156 [Poronia punctata]|nr:hypothetical protein GGS20DRAFT_576156 [Poronia punctata]